MELTYTIAEIKKIVSESVDEFQPKLGDGVATKNKEINKDAYDDAEKRAKDYDNGLNIETSVDDPKQNESDPNLKSDYNRTNMDWDVINGNEESAKRYKAQMKGYNSVAEMERVENENDPNDPRIQNKDKAEKYYDALKKNKEDLDTQRKNVQKTGLQAREMPSSTFERDNLYGKANNVNESKIKVISFKHTKFLTENHMKSRIPDEFKVDGMRFRMKDKAGNNFLCEWKENDAIILEHKNMEAFNDSLARIKNLSNYHSNDHFVGTTPQTRINEANSAFEDTLAKMRKIIK